MASSEDFKRILELYNQESKTSGVSIVAFCQKNGTFIPSLNVGTRTDIRSRFMRLILLIEMVQSQRRIQNCKTLVTMLLKFPSRKMSDFPSRHCLQYS